MMCGGYLLLCCIYSVFYTSPEVADLQIMNNLWLNLSDEVDLVHDICPDCDEGVHHSANRGLQRFLE